MNRQEKKYWNNKAWLYNNMFEKTSCYRQMYALIKEAVDKDMAVLEVGTGTGMIAREIADNVKRVQATDYSEEMINRAKSIKHPRNIDFSCADIFDLPFEPNSFDAVIASNILHIIPNPEKALNEIRRMLKDNGILICPTFMWRKPSFWGKIKQAFMLLNGFPIHSKWGEQSFVDFIETNRFEVMNSKIIKADFDICYIEARNNTK